MDHFTAPPQDPAGNPAPDPDENWPRSGPNIALLLLAILVIAAVVVYAVFRWKNRPEDHSPAAPEVAVGDSRERVVDILGKPRGTTLVGGQEILIYSNGQVIIENGVAASVEIGSGRQRGEVTSEGSQIILQKGGRIVEEEKAGP
ncbi:MAG TPA: hypothetical protein P5567_10815 [Kiritimatiellia bacterium]|nr:hypothetical protein [Kiritimatiellia bacterium]HRZ12932.1 hypothetical protein [Kiritimatiellia bacterium]HSA18458.1 hypothetical protein [Kiritimatiellia bacterium]